MARFEIQWTIMKLFSPVNRKFRNLPYGTITASDSEKKYRGYTIKNTYVSLMEPFQVAAEVRIYVFG